MALVVESTSTATANDANSLTINKPTGTAEDDLLLLLANGNGLTKPTSSGFTESASEVYNGAIDMTVGILYKIAGASEPSTYTVNVANGVCGGATMLRISGWATTGDPVWGSENINGNHDTASATLSSGTIAIDRPSDNLVIILLGHIGDNAVTSSNYTITTSGSNPSWTEVQDATYTVSSGTYDMSIATAYANDTDNSDITGYSIDIASTTAGNGEDYAGICYVICQPQNVTPDLDHVAVTPAIFEPEVTQVNVALDVDHVNVTPSIGGIEVDENSPPPWTQGATPSDSWSQESQPSDTWTQETQPSDNWTQET